MNVRRPRHVQTANSIVINIGFCDVLEPDVDDIELQMLLDLPAPSNGFQKIVISCHTPNFEYARRNMTPAHCMTIFMVPTNKIFLELPVGCNGGLELPGG